MDKRAKSSPPLTNEELAKKFKSNFELVNHAIKMAENMIRTGRDRIEAEFQNRAMMVLEEINTGKVSLDKDLNLKNASSQDHFMFDEDLKPQLIYEDEEREGRYRTTEVREDE